MGYTTDFKGAFEFNKPIAPDIENYVNAFSRTRRMKRANNRIVLMDPDWQNHCWHGELGTDGEYYIVPALPPKAMRNLPDWMQSRLKVEEDGLVHDEYGQLHDFSVENYNVPPETQPGLWCQWIIQDGKLVWDGGEKFYRFVPWLRYLIDRFFAPSGYVLHGTVEWQGEDLEDKGLIQVIDNKITVWKVDPELSDELIDEEEEEDNEEE